MATIVDVAKRAGVSPITVSRVMNKSSLVTEKTIHRVMEAATALDYKPNLIARSLVTRGKTRTIGVILTHIENPIYSVVLSGIAEKAAAFDYNILISYTNDADDALVSINTLLSKQIDALIVLPIEIQKGFSAEDTVHILNDFYAKLELVAQNCRKNNLPVVVLGDIDVPSAIGAVRDDYRRGARMAVEYLISQNHHNIGFLSHAFKDKGLWAERYNGFIEGMREHGCPVKEASVVYCQETIESAAGAMNELLDQPDRPTAVYCANDLIAFGAIHSILGRGLRIPDDISLIGHDGNYIGGMIYPKLTTVSIHPFEMGRECIQIVLSALQNQEFGRTVVISPTIIERETVRRLPG